MVVTFLLSRQYLIITWVKIQTFSNVPVTAYSNNTHLTLFCLSEQNEDFQKKYLLSSPNPFKCHDTKMQMLIFSLNMKDIFSFIHFSAKRYKSNEFFSLFIKTIMKVPFSSSLNFLISLLSLKPTIHCEIKSQKQERF